MLLKRVDFRDVGSGEEGQTDEVAKTLTTGKPAADDLSKVEVRLAYLFVCQFSLFICFLSIHFSVCLFISL